MTRLAIALLTAAGLVAATPALAEDPRELSWEELMPAGEEELLMQMYEEQMEALLEQGPIEEGSPMDAPIQIGTFNVVEELDGEFVRIPGFLVPFEMNGGKISEFLLVPYFGACIHTPPPPPNQIVYVTAEEPVEFSWDAFWLTGTLTAERNMNDMGNAAYTLKLAKIELYDGW
jgi:hypothetical protein